MKESKRQREKEREREKALSSPKYTAEITLHIEVKNTLGQDAIVDHAMT